MSINDMTRRLPPYPMEELFKRKQSLLKQGRKVFDFGSGDPSLDLWPPIRAALIKELRTTTSYPSIRGNSSLKKSIQNYLERRHFIRSDHLAIFPSRGSKEAIFHIALSLIGRCPEQNLMIFPTPGYPVYEKSILFAGGKPYPYELTPENEYLLEPWTLSSNIAQQAAAIWVNYPHNPTGTCVSLSYWENLIDWCHETDTVLLSDDCYIDIYYPELKQDTRPQTPLKISQDRVISFMSLSKRSGLTGYRSGFIAGDPEILDPHIRLRSHCGLGQPDFIQAASVVAWNDDEHVYARQNIFRRRLELVAEKISALIPCHVEIPEATFYLWIKLPETYRDIDFSLRLAEAGVIVTPSSWLGNVPGYIRMAMSQNLDEIEEVFRLSVWAS